LPWAAHVWALALLVPLSVGLAYKVFITDPGPYGNWITYHRVCALNAAEIAGRQPPKYRVSFTTPADLPPVVEANESRYVSHFRYLEYDLPALPWALGTTPRADPPASAVTRHQVYAMDPAIPAAVLGVAWAIWVWRFVRYRRRNPLRSMGFEVFPASTRRD
jgi:hypothetical protein